MPGVFSLLPFAAHDEGTRQMRLLLLLLQACACLRVAGQSLNELPFGDVSGAVSLTGSAELNAGRLALQPLASAAWYDAGLLRDSGFVLRATLQWDVESPGLDGVAVAVQQGTWIRGW